MYCIAASKLQKVCDARDVAWFGDSRRLPTPTRAYISGFNSALIAARGEHTMYHCSYFFLLLYHQILHRCIIGLHWFKRLLIAKTATWCVRGLPLAALLDLDHGRRCPPGIPFHKPGTCTRLAADIFILV